MKKNQTLTKDRENWEIKVHFKLLKQEITLQELSQLKVGEVFGYQPLDEELEICIAGKTIAKGQLLTRGDKYFVKVVEIL